jgi:hypothetical protein
MMKTSLFSLALPFLLLTAAACGGDDGSARSSAEIKADWDAHCDTSAACPLSETDPVECKAELTCLDATLRADMLDRMAACQKARTCTTGDDACFSLEAQGLTPSATASTFQTDCLAKHSTCTTAGTTFSDDYCSGAGIFQDSLIASMSSCLSGACTDVGDCVEGKVAAAAPDCTGF